MYTKNTQSRKWLYTIQNPTQLKLTPEYIQGKLGELVSVEYYCYCREIASTGQEHLHIFLYSNAPIRFGTLKRKFPTAHIDKAIGSCIENRTYLKK